MEKIKCVDVMDCETITNVMNSELISQEEKNYFINMVCRYYHINNVELENGTEIETMERTNLYFDIVRLIARVRLDLDNDKYIIYSFDDNSYINYDNEVMDDEDLLSTITDIKLFRTKEKAIQTIEELKLNGFQVIQARELTILNGDSVYDWIEPLN